MSRLRVRPWVKRSAPSGWDAEYRCSTHNSRVAQTIQNLQTPFIALVVTPVGLTGQLQCIDVGTGLALPSAWLLSAPFPVQRLNGSYPDTAVVASPLSTLAMYVNSVGGAANVTMAYKYLVAALGLTTANNGYDIAMCVDCFI